MYMVIEGGERDRYKKSFTSLEWWLNFDEESNTSSLILSSESLFIQKKKKTEKVRFRNFKLFLDEYVSFSHLFEHLFLEDMLLDFTGLKKGL